MTISKAFSALAGLFLSVLPMYGQYKLWYNEPAQVWTDALPLGNGRLGAMVYGIPSTEHIQLNEETIWTGQPNHNANKKALNAIPKIQQLLKVDIIQLIKWLTIMSCRVPIGVWLIKPLAMYISLLQML